MTAVAPERVPATVRSPVIVIPLVLVATSILADESVKLTTDTLPVSIVTVPVPERESNTTESIDVGMSA